MSSRRKSTLKPRVVQDEDVEILDDEDTDKQTKSKSKPNTNPTPSKTRSKRIITPVKRYIEETESSKTPKKVSPTVAVSSSEDEPDGNTLKTPKKKITVETAKTPHSLRVRIRKKLDKLKIVTPSSSENDFSDDDEDDDREFKPSNKDISSSESEDESEEDDSNSDDAIGQPKQKSSYLSDNVIPIARGRIKTNQNDFVLQSDEYFTTHSSNKAFTSDRTLDSLKTPRLQHDKLFALLESMKIPAAHEKAIADIIKEYKMNFAKWLVLLDEGFSILLYGLGSKMKLLEDFHESCLSRRNVLVVNGFFPALNVKDIVENVAVKFLDMSVPSGNLNVGLDMIEEVLSDNPQFHIFLIIHNIDGVMLRNDKAQKILGRLVKVPNIHLIASIDHINAPMLWNPEKLACFNFSWWDVTTLLPYSNETAFENSILVQNSGALALSSLKNVFLSLTTNAKGIYLIIVDHQLTEKENAHYQGMLFKTLYLKCRESFLVSSDLALRAQLTEFLDHKLVKMKRSADGKEHLNIPIENKLLQKFKDELAEQ